MQQQTCESPVQTTHCNSILASFVSSWPCFVLFLSYTYPTNDTMASSLNDGATGNAAAASASICIPCSELNESALLSLDQVKTELTTMPLWSLAAIVPSRDHAQGGSVAATATTASLPTTSTSTTTSTSSSQGWCLCRYFVTKNFEAALAAINAIGTIAERENHHPDLHLIQYRSVEIILWTHKLSGITRNDIQLAKSIDSEVTNIQYSPKWLAENNHHQPPP
jgi:pterin-4a-carbinolamine dehydratase